MSSAALQATQQPSRPYQQASQTRVPYYAQTSPNSAGTPASSRKRPSSNGAFPNSPTTPQQPSFYTSGGSPSTLTPRSQPLPPSAHASPLEAHAPQSPYSQARSNMAESIGGPPTAPPPRTSSYQQSGQTITASDRSPSSRYAQQQEGGYGSGQEGDRMRDDTATAAAAAAQSRRRVQQPPKDSPYRSSEPRESGSIQPTTQSRTASGVEPPLMETDLLKDDSTIINRLVLDDPKDDIEREMARLAEAQPVPIGSDVTPITGLGLVGSEGVDDGGRGSDRSRQDHSKSAQARRETKFGEYIL
ncbi:hypothetical protein LTR16_007616, partial [Cryomyces antarcticus]